MLTVLLQYSKNEIFIINYITLKTKKGWLINMTNVTDKVRTAETEEKKTPDK